ncbi:Caspase domain-containing protein [Paracoccus aminovorans]|uniref:Caspase domain-containing protein n=1 Tax=Paracoccus aminovorans TaxID=34004 RepID=A0A1I3BCM0_9RHOB|nr:peptidoglycan-binding protein [Paracoccus aminovorans]CQR84755.1 hypothetical protein JCM7685_0169 [Paracoccus aminovorans]SFH60038.1 Caspase domain-containing protein [Paracoccus aminovorans]
MRFAAVMLAVLAGTAPAWAENRAVIIGNANYESAPDLAGSDTAALAKALRAAGFTTQDGVDLTGEPLRRTLEALARADDRPGARIVALNGRFLHDAGETWFMGTDVGRPGPLSAGTQGVPLSLVMRLMAGGDPGAVLILGTDAQQSPHDPGLASGIGLTEAPEGVSVLTGTPEAGALALAELLRGGSLAQAAALDRALTLLPGSAGDLVPLGRAGSQAEDPLAGDRDAWARAAAADSAAAYQAYLREFPRGLYSAAAQERLAQVRDAAAGRNADRDAWAEAAAENRAAGYEAYLKRFPQGRYAQAARDRLEALHPPRPTPQPQVSPAAAAELALDLGPAERATLQRRLARLGHASGSADGVFGSRSRKAIASWQRANGLAPTGYLNRAQIQKIASQSQRAEDEVAARDRAYLQQTGAKGDAEGLRAYLKRYPDGLHAETARRQLAGLPGQGTQPDTPRGEEPTWQWARRQGSAAGYQTYLDRFPRGPHAAEARDRLATLRAGIEAARREEDSLRLNPSTRRLVEERLRLAGMRPGPVDGQFTAQTRDALRRYQAARNLRVTGYLTQQTVASLLQDAVLR